MLESGIGENGRKLPKKSGRSLARARRIASPRQVAWLTPASVADMMNRMTKPGNVLCALHELATR